MEHLAAGDTAALTAIRVRPAEPADLPELAVVAGVTFPLACPPSATAENVAAFIATNLSVESFAEYLCDPDRIVLVATGTLNSADTRILGYAMLILGVPENDADVQRAVTPRPAVQISKMYALPDAHGAGVANALMTESLRRGEELGTQCVWLGVNQQNRRAQRFYAKSGFHIAGTKTFRLGDGIENDYVMVRPF